MKILVSILLSMFWIGILGQNIESAYIDFGNAQDVSILNNPRQLNSLNVLHLDHCESEKMMKLALENISFISSITTLVISNYSSDKFPKELQNCKNINQITFLNCKNLPFKSVVKYLGSLPSFEGLNVGNCRIDEIPREIKGLNQLRKLNISLNNNIDLKESIDALAQCENLQVLDLPINQLSELPENISKLVHLKELNLSNNNLIDLPNSIGDMDSLETLRLKKNIIIEPLKTYSKVKNLNIKYLSIDEVSEEDLIKLQKLFPNAKIEQSEKKNLESFEHQEILKDSIVDEVFDERALVADSTSDEEMVHYRKSLGLKVHSLAYLKYANVFDPLMNQNSEIDSMLFDERYLDSNYYNVFRKQQGLDYDYFDLKRVKGVPKDKFAFTFKVTEYFYSNFAEYFAFNGMYWMVVGINLNPKDLNASFVKNQKYTDFRLKFNSALQHFELTLKTNAEFRTIKVVPVFSKSKGSLSSFQLSYEPRYLKYLESLDNRRESFNKKQQNKKTEFRLKITKMNADSWDDFTKQYFSEEEKELKKGEWLTYFDQIVENENEALLNSDLDENYLQRLLVLNNFEKIISVKETNSLYGLKPYSIHFKDEKGKEMSIRELFVIDDDLMCYRHYQGSNGPMNFNVFSTSNGVMDVVAVLRNGDFAVANDVSFSNYKPSEMDVREVLIMKMAKEYTNMFDIFKKIKL